MSVHRFNENRGGPRPGAGRPKRTLSQAAVEWAWKTRDKYEQRYGKSVEELLLDIAYAVDWAKDVSVHVRLKAIQEIHRLTSPPLSEDGEANQRGVIVRLPVRQDDPGKVVRFDTGEASDE